METMTFEIQCPACEGTATAVATSATTAVRWVCQRCQVIGLMPAPQPVQLPLSLLRPVAAA